MSSGAGISNDHWIYSSLWGIGRGVTVHSLIYPLEVIKIRQQCSQSESKSLKIALHLWQTEGVGAF